MESATAYPLPSLASRPMAKERLLTLATMAELLGCDRTTAWRYTQRDDFPAPVAELPTGRVWDAAAVKKWGRRLPLDVGRPSRKKGKRKK
jgi:predicted DNA-binding transcriptional regulator AlpA